MKSGEDFRRALGQADDGFVKVIDRVLSDLRVLPKRRGARSASGTMATGQGRPQRVQRDA